MREFMKVFCVLLICAGAVAGALAWFDERPDQPTWLFRIGGPALVLLGLGGFLKIHFRRDEVPDYLHRLCGGYFDRGGFCFAFAADERNGICYIDAYFQNRHEGACLGRIALRPVRGLFGKRGIEAITYEVECQPAAFGVVRVPLPVPRGMQGRRQKFEVGASVEYPNGKGRMLRFRDGIVIRTNSDFGDTFGTTLMLAGALGGALVLSKPASVTIDLPIGVAEEVPDHIGPEVKTLWRQGDPPLDELG